MQQTYQSSCLFQFPFDQVRMYVFVSYKDAVPRTECSYAVNTLFIRFSLLIIYNNLLGFLQKQGLLNNEQTWSLFVEHVVLMFVYFCGILTLVNLDAMFQQSCENSRFSTNLQLTRWYRNSCIFEKISGRYQLQKMSVKLTYYRILSLRL